MFFFCFLLDHFADVNFETKINLKLFVAEYIGTDIDP